MSDKVSQMDIDATMAPETMGSSVSPSSLGWIDDYVLVRELGGGGFGSVYLVLDPKTKVEYAVKGLPAIVRQNKEELENVLANFRLVQGLEGHHIAQMRFVHYPKKVNYFYKEDREKLRVETGDPLIVMSYAPGMTLSKWRKMQPGGRVPHEKAVEIVRQIADALDYAHHANPPIIHRDVKPSNVMIEDRADGSFYCRVLDFGLAAEIRTTMGRISMEIRDVCGTRPYMAPEQWVGDRQGPGTDQYALAVLYCELVTGKVPFRSAFDTGDVEIMKSAVLTRRPDLSEVPRVARKAVARALAKKLNRRYPTCMDFAEALTKRGLNRLVIAVGLVVLVSAVLCLKLSQSVLLSTPAPTSAPSTPPVPAPLPPSAPTHPPPPPHTHRFGDWVTNSVQGCERIGRLTRSCFASGCSNPPETEVKDLPAVGHNWGPWSAVTAAGVGIPGSEKSVCARCGSERMREIAPLPPPHVHSYGVWGTNVVPTCEGRGRRTRVCVAVGCGNPPVSQVEDVPATGHDWGLWNVESRARIGVAGLKKRVCRHCLREEKLVLPPLQHPPVPSKPPVDTSLIERLQSGSEFLPNPPKRAAGMQMSLTLPGGSKMNFVWCPPGRFLMGSPESEPMREDGERQHVVTLTKGFWMAQTEVTHDQWKAVIGSHSHLTWGFVGQEPADRVSWEKCQQFCRQMSHDTGRRVRLPTEAEWEYACRAGTATPFSFGCALSGNGPLASCSCVNEPYGTSEMGGTSTGADDVGSHGNNPWGLCDMHGNLYEWCSDWYGDYPENDVKDPTGPQSGGSRVIRGGCWNYAPKFCRSAYRSRKNPTASDTVTGFRVVCVEEIQ